MDNIPIALVQMQAMVGETEKNLQTMEKFVKEAKRKGVKIICFPELACQGYTGELAGQLAETVPGPISHWLANLARENNIAILTGIIEKSPETKPYITHLICTSRGELYKYRKTHLGGSEEKYFSPGGQLPVFEAEGAKFAVQICWEMHFPEVSTIYSLKGAEIIFAPHASPAIIGNRKEIWLKYMTARAYDNSVFVAGCNLIGDNGHGICFGGGCLVIDPKGRVIGEDFSGQEGMLTVQLSSEEINKIRYQERKSMADSFYLEYRRPELYTDLLGKINK
ncbi:MAG: nitrilase [Clostridia bacterium]|nr:nitrilase [Clostridia bacterium]